MRVPLVVASLLAASLAGPAVAAPIEKGLGVTAFFMQLKDHAAELAEGGMDLNMVQCNADGTTCGGYYGAANVVTAIAPDKDADMDTIIINQVEVGETEDFWLTTGLVSDILDGDFKTIPERSQMILDAMKGPSGTAFQMNVGVYTFGRWPDGRSQVVITGKPRM